MRLCNRCQRNYVMDDDYKVCHNCYEVARCKARAILAETKHYNPKRGLLTAIILYVIWAALWRMAVIGLVCLGALHLYHLFKG